MFYFSDLCYSSCLYCIPVWVIVFPPPPPPPGSISNEKVNGHQAFEYLSFLGEPWRTHFSLQTAHFTIVTVANNNSLLFREPHTYVFQLYFHLRKFLKALPLYMLLLSSISNKDVLFIFSANKVVAEEVP